MNFECYGWVNGGVGCGVYRVIFGGDFGFVGIFKCFC